MQEGEHVLKLLKEAKKAFTDSDSYELRELSNETIHSAAVYQDPDNIIVAVLLYSLSKLIEREHYKEMPGWDGFYLALLKNWEAAIKSLEKKDIDSFREYMGEIREAVNKISGDLRNYIGEVFRKAEINKAFKLYEHGLSSEQTANLLGVSLWDLASYIGQSTISEAKLGDTMPVRDRVKLVEDMFK